MTVRNSGQDIQDHPNSENDAEIDEKKLKYPKSVFFIISNEFCERFSFYGMRTVLTLYLVQSLKYDDSTTTVIYHAFTMLAYFFPLLGAMLADSWLGKFRTIFYLSIIYAAGQILLALAAAPPIGLSPREFSMLGLVLIAIGTGGIKPCVSAFGGDQFILPQQERYLSTFFSIFYFSINFGSLISSFLTPELRRGVKCFGENSCYSLAFMVPAVLMTISIVIFVLGRPLYRITKPKDNVIVQVSKCISHAIYNKVTSKKKRDHWLDYADDQYDKTMISDIRDTLQVLMLFIPIPIFWALFDQQGSRWTLQAARMNGEIGSWLLQPDQMQVINPLLVLAFIPLFEACIYPLMAKIGIRSPLRKLTIGGLLAALAFVVSAIVEYQLEPTYAVLPTQGGAQVRFFNTLNCNGNVTLEDSNFDLPPMEMWVNKSISVNGIREMNFTADFTRCKIPTWNDTSTGKINVSEAKATSWVFMQNDFVQYEDSVQKSSSGNPLIRVVLSKDNLDEEIEFEIYDGNGRVFNTTVKDPRKTMTDLNETVPGMYDIHLNGKKMLSGVPLKLGGVYTFVGNTIPGYTNLSVIQITEPNTMHVLWMIPQYVLITMGEVMFSVTGLEFAFTQAPSSMKSILQATWQLTVAVGNLIVLIIAEAKIFDRQIFEFLLFAGLMAVDMILFAIMAQFYRYIVTPEEEVASDDIHMKEERGILNKSYQDDEKRTD
nr:peptide transporter family 1 isoform X1 [Megalopta genalis]XP_033330925.1 peptide transporter family 1 isoform X2 [Megalopta genalis]